MARLIATSRIDAAGLQWRGPAGEGGTSWAGLGAGEPDAFGLPPLRAKYFFTDPFPKFGRMDALCKLAVAATQLIQRAGGFDGLDRDQVAQCGGTALGCLEVDAQFEASRKQGAPSPALFVYTLPSMFQGEVAIQFKLRGRCALVSCGAQSEEAALDMAIRWVDKARAPAVLAISAEAAGPAAKASGQRVVTTARAWLLVEGGTALTVRQLTDAMEA